MPIVDSGYPGIAFEVPDVSVSAAFPALVAEALRKICSGGPNGKKLMDEFPKHARHKKSYLGNQIVLIQRAYSWIDGHKTNGIFSDSSKDGSKGLNWLAGSKCIRVDEAAACGGGGCGSKVLWNPNVIATPDGSRPSFIGLAHELVHAFRNARGEANADTQTEEYLTVGITDGYVINENMIRSEHSIEGRKTYVGV
jgi:Effector protein